MNTLYFSLLFTLPFLSSAMDTKKLLKRAAIEGDVVKLEHGLANDPSEIWLNKALIKAIYNGKCEVALRLIETGAPVKKYSWDRTTSGTYQILWDVFNAYQLNTLSLAQAEKIVEKMVERPEVEVDERDARGQTPLLLAARLKSEAMVRSMLAHGANLKYLTGNPEALQFATCIHNSIN